MKIWVHFIDWKESWKSVNFRFCHALCKKIGQFVCLPSPEEAQDIANENFQKTGFPQAYGAIDGCHIHVKPPQIGISDYINRKRYPSIVLQGVVDNRYRPVKTSAWHWLLVCMCRIISDLETFLQRCQEVFMMRQFLKPLEYMNKRTSSLKFVCSHNFDKYGYM